jgi:hypothetical protein
MLWGESNRRNPAPPNLGLDRGNGCADIASTGSDLGCRRPDLTVFDVGQGYRARILPDYWLHLGYRRLSFTRFGWIQDIRILNFTRFGLTSAVRRPRPH